MNSEAPKTKDFYNRYWDRSNAETFTPKQGEWSEEKFTHILGVLRDAGRVLDVGCGDACHYHPRLSACVDELQGLDVSETAVAAAREKGFQVRGHEVDSEPFPFSDDFFDGACSIEVLEHLMDPLYAACEVNRVLRPGGHFVVTVPNFGYFGDRLEALLRARVRSSPVDPVHNPYAGAHIRFFNASLLGNLLRDAGFEVEEIGAAGDSSIFDVFWVLGKYGTIAGWARTRLPSLLRLGFLANLWPGLFARHLHAVARKPAAD